MQCNTWDLFPWPGIDPSPLHWEHGVSATGPAGKSLSASLRLAIKVSSWLEVTVFTIHPRTPADVQTSFSQTPLWLTPSLWSRNMVSSRKKMPLSLFIQCPLISCRCLLGKLSGREFLRQSTVSSDHIPPQLVLIQYLVPVYDYAETIRTKVTRDSYPAKDQLIWILSGTLLPQNSGKVCLLDVCSLSDWDFPGLFRLFWLALLLIITGFLSPTAPCISVSGCLLPSCVLNSLIRLMFLWVLILGIIRIYIFSQDQDI